MSHKLIAFLIFFYISGQMLSLLLDGEYLGSSEATDMGNIVIANQITQAGEGGVLSLAKAAPGFFGSLIKMVMWDYSYLDGEMSIAKYVLLWPLSGGLIITLTYMSLIAIQGLFSAFRAATGG